MQLEQTINVLTQVLRYIPVHAKAHVSVIISGKFVRIGLNNENINVPPDCKSYWIDDDGVVRKYKQAYVVNPDKTINKDGIELIMLMLSTGISRWTIAKSLGVDSKAVAAIQTSLDEVKKGKSNA